MKSKIKSSLGQAVAIILIVTMLMPQVVLANVTAIEADTYEVMQPSITEETENAGEQLTLLEELSAEELEMLLQEQEAYWSQYLHIREKNEFSNLLNGTVGYSGLTESERFFIYRQLDILYEAIEITNELFKIMERDGYTLAESVELIRIMSTGMFDYIEAQKIHASMPSKGERETELAAFERFAQRFDIAERVTARRLINRPFTAINMFETFDPFATFNAFEETIEERQAREVRNLADIADILSSNRSAGQYSFIETARTIEQGIRPD